MHALCQIPWSLLKFLLPNKKHIATMRFNFGSREDRMKKYILALSALLMGSTIGFSAHAEDGWKSNDVFNQEIMLTRAAVETQRKAVIIQNIHLSAEEDAAFWTVYNDYRKDMQKNGDKRVEVITDYADAYRNGNLSDKAAGKLLDNYLNVLQNQIKIKKKYVHKFKKVLPVKKVALFYQIDNRLDILLNMQIANGVPLIE